MKRKGLLGISVAVELSMVGLERYKKEASNRAWSSSGMSGDCWYCSGLWVYGGTVGLGVDVGCVAG